jgi:hypothetical protein
VRVLEAAAKAAELRIAQLAEPEVSRLWEITLGDGRKTQQTALDAVSLQKRLTNGATVRAQIFPSGYRVPLDGPSLFDGLICRARAGASGVAFRARSRDQARRRGIILVIQ